jgi:GT2 family glycosyltransferase
MSEVSIIVSNKNRLNLLKNCLNSIDVFTKDISYDLYIIDSNSTDGSRDYLKENYSNRADLIFEDIQSTYAESNNRVMRKCNTPYIYLLNNDCLVSNRWLLNAVNFAKSDLKVGHVASLVLFEDNKVQSHGANILSNGNTHCCYHGLDRHDALLSKVNNYAYAGLGLYRKDLLEQYDYMPEYPCKIYFSDTGWGMRLWENGYDVRYCPSSIVYHLLHNSERTGHNQDINNGRIAFMLEYGDFLKSNNGFSPDYPFTGKRPYQNRSK